MKKIAPISFLLALVLTGCLGKADNNVCAGYDDCARKAPDSEILSVRDYLQMNGIVAIQHCSGVFYTIDDPGTGVSPNDCNGVSFTYTGKLTDGTVFGESQTPVAHPLNGLIAGWRNVLPLLKKGGKIRLYIPPFLGYGNQQNGNIPPNSILIFEVTLVDVL